MSERHELDASALARVCLGKADVRLLVIFGSVASGKARSDSDVDVGILGGALFEQQALGAEIGGQLGGTRMWWISRPLRNGCVSRSLVTAF